MVRPGASALVGELQRVREEFLDVARDAASLAAPLTDAQFAWKPAADAWSIGECLSHLNATARACLPRLDEAIAEGIRGGLYGEGPFRYGWLDRLILRASEPPSRWHVWSPAAFLPAHGEPRDEVLGTFQDFQDELIDRLRRADGLDLVRVRVTSPVAGWRRFSLGAAFAVIAAHERRHLWQARSVAALPHFPR
jgi:hypothetical protein